MPRRPPVPPLPPVEWTPEAAEREAEALGLRLSARHWQVLACAREECMRTRHLPDACALSACASLTRQELEALFPGATCALVHRLAGLAGRQPGETRRFKDVRHRD